MGGPRAGRAGAGVSAAQLPAHRDVEATYNDINGFVFFIEELKKLIRRYFVLVYIWYFQRIGNIHF